MSSQAAAQTCSFFLARLTAEVNRLQNIVYPGHHPGPKKWLGFVSGVLDTARNYLEVSRIAPSSSTESELIVYAEFLGGNAYKFLNVVSGTEATDIPHQVVAPFQRWVDGLSIKNDIFFRAEHSSNYEIKWLNYGHWKTAINQPSESLQMALETIRWPVLTVTVPSHAMGMLPHFAVVAHELGHAIEERITPNLDAHSELASETHDRIEARLKAIGLQFGDDEQLEVQKIVESWLAELKGDAVGHLLAGPAFFFALCGFLELTGRQYGIGATHPPSDLRRDFLFTELQSGSPSFVQVLQAECGLSLNVDTNSPHIPFCPDKDDLFSQIEGRVGPLKAAIAVELLPYIRSIGPYVFSAAREHLQKECGSLIYTPQQFEADIRDFVTPLCNLVPPIEREVNGKTEPASLSSVLNVGWITLLTRLNDLSTPDDSPGDPIAKKMERLHDLLLKAVELSEAKRVWEEHR